MSEHTPLTEAEREALTRALLDNDEHEGDWLIDYVFPAVERIKADAHRAGVNRGWGLGFKHTTAALAARTSTATADTGLRERVEALADEIAEIRRAATAALEPKTCEPHMSTGALLRCDQCRARSEAFHEMRDLLDPSTVLTLLDATPASTEDRADNEGTP